MNELKPCSGPWKLTELPGGHNWTIIQEETGIHLANVGDAKQSKATGYLSGNQILANASAIVKAVNGTYGAGINPEAVPELKTALLFAMEEIKNLIAEKYDAATAEEYIAIKLGKAAIEMAKL